VYTLDTYDWPNLLNSTACPPACPGTLIGKTVLSDTDMAYLDPDLKPIRLQEITAGVEHQLTPNLSFAARYVHKQIDRAVEDIGYVKTTDGITYEEDYTIGNPGFGRATLAYPGVPMPKAVRDYDAFELSARRLMRGNWALNASYTYSRLWGNYSGLSESDEEGRVSPYVGRGYDNPVIMFDEKARPVYGLLATDRPHQVKITGTYAGPFRTSFTLFQVFASGVPVSRVVGVMPCCGYPVMYQGRMSDGRTPALSRSDVYVQKEFLLRDRYRVAIGMTVTNLLNQATVTSIYPRQTDDLIDLKEPDFYAGTLDFRQLIAEQNIPRDPQFLKPLAFQSPRSIRLMLKWTF
jgi:hypothetical protein